MCIRDSLHEGYAVAALGFVIDVEELLPFLFGFAMRRPVAEHDDVGGCLLYTSRCV